MTSRRRYFSLLMITALLAVPVQAHVIQGSQADAMSHGLTHFVQVLALFILLLAGIAGVHMSKGK